MIYHFITHFTIAKSKKELTNVSYDPARLLTINCLFAIRKTTILTIVQIVYLLSILIYDILYP